MTLVKMNRMRKVYPMGEGEVVALDAVDLSIGRGEYVGIIGRSGSGKSTLLHLMGCLDQPSSGSYELNGQDVGQLDDEALARVRGTQIGFVFQSFHLIPQLTVRENIALPFLYQNVGGGGIGIDEAARRVGLDHRLDHRPNQLSGGEMQRVAIARALAINPAIILADEPTGNLDTATGRAILDLFRSLNKDGATIVVVTHDPKVAEECDRVVEMADAKIIRETRK